MIPPRNALQSSSMNEIHGLFEIDVGVAAEYVASRIAYTLRPKTQSRF